MEAVRCVRELEAPSYLHELVKRLVSSAVVDGGPREFELALALTSKLAEEDLLTPEQARILPISDRFNDYAEKLSKVLENSDIRALVDARSEKVGKKIREAELDKVPYMLIVGESEASEGTVSVRKQGEGDLGSVSIEAFAERIQREVAEMLANNI